LHINGFAQKNPICENSLFRGDHLDRAGNLREIRAGAGNCSAGLAIETKTERVSEIAIAGPFATPMARTRYHWLPLLSLSGAGDGAGDGAVVSIVTQNDTLLFPSVPVEKLRGVWET
jgi:hypothetical protein